MEPARSILHVPTRTLPRIVAIGAVLGIGAALPGFTADAAGVPNAITAVRIDESTVDLYSSFRLNLQWAVPESAGAGDTFTLRLPEQLVAVEGTTFDLRSPEGDVVADARVVNGVATFTLTSFAATHQQVHGTAWFYVQLRRGANPGESLNLRFDADGAIFTDTVAVTGSPQDYSHSATKWMAWVDPGLEKPPLPARDVLLWSIVAPRVTPTTAGATVTFIDEPGAGSKIDCDTILGFWGKTNTGGADYDSFMGPNRYTKTCSPDRLELTLTTSSDDVGKIPYILGHSYLSGPKQEVYRNSGRVLVERGGRYSVGDSVRWGGGGDGSGILPTAPATTPPSTPSTTTGPPASGTPTTSTPPVATGTPTPPSTTSTPPVASGTPTTSTPPVVTGTPTPPSTTSTPPVASGTPTTSTPPVATTTQPPVAPGTTAPAPTGPVPGTPPVARGTTAPPAGSRPPLSSGTSTPTAGANTAPTRIDTGEPDVAGRNGWLVTAGVVLIAAAGLGLLGLGRGRRRGERR